MILSLTRRRLRNGGAVAVITGALLAATPMVVPAQAASPTVSAKGAFLLDSGTGKTLYSKSSNYRREMASTTKIMTAAVVLSTKNLDLNRKVTVKKAYPDYVQRVGGSSAYLYVGDKLTVRGMLNAMMAPSGCDAAYALADTFGKGSTRTARKADFIKKMNAKARSLGLTNTKYDSFDGISAKGQNYTTPRDLAKLTRYAMKKSVFRSIVKAPQGKATATAANGRTRWYTWNNTNLLVRPKPGGYAYPGAIGVKTGTGTKAGKCLVFAATRNGKTVIGVLLNDEERYTDSMKLMDRYLGSPSKSTGLSSRTAAKPIADVLD
ncbi:D-alanyl-D-alanine carboxypeptidase family protein [Streptomyces sp. NPDC006879]|uniref:D-alanyl-D-alanine carboxypeptidase family protein n=1 Tax=Streptomyces sp. NPDC006879 TaxID=3364767 RepID=UPI0036BD7F99